MPTYASRRASGNWSIGSFKTLWNPWLRVWGITQVNGHRDQSMEPFGVTIPSIYAKPSSVWWVRRGQLRWQPLPVRQPIWQEYLLNLCQQSKTQMLLQTLVCARNGAINALACHTRMRVTCNLQCNNHEGLVGIAMKPCEISWTHCLFAKQSQMIENCHSHQACRSTWTSQVYNKPWYDVSSLAANTQGLFLVHECLKGVTCL